MEIYINLKELEELHLTPSMYCYLYCLYYKKPYTLVKDTVISMMDKRLEEMGYLKRTAEDIILREQANKLFQKGTPTDESVAEWIDTWRMLFPQGVKSGNRPVRGDKQGVLKKMKTFIKTNPQYSKEQIFEATKQYVFEASLKNYNYMICADYFINKGGSSVLGALIEDIAIKGSSLTNNQKGGGSRWHREI